MRTAPTSPHGRFGFATQLLSDATVAFAARLGGAALTYVAFVWSSRWIGREQFGLYQFAYSAAMVLATLCCLGLPQAAQRFLAEGIARNAMGSIRGFLHWGRRTTILTGLVGGVVGAVVLPLLPFESVSTATAVSLIALPLWCLIRFQTSVAQAFSRVRLMALPNNIHRPFFFLAGMLLFSRMGWEAGAAELMAWHVVVLGVVVVGQGWFLRRSLASTVPEGELEVTADAWRKTAAPLLLVSLATSFYPELCNVSIGLVLEAEELALFSTAFRTAFLISFAVMAVDSVTLPKAAQAFSRGDLHEMERIVRQATLLRTLSAVGGLVGVAVCGRFILSLFGEGFDSAYPSLLLLAGAMVVRGAVGPGLEILSITGQQNRSFALCVLHTSVTFLVLPFLTWRYGVAGGAWGVVATTLLLGVMALIAVVRHVGVEPCLLRRSRTTPS